MKTKLFLAAVAVTFSFAVMSCSGNKATNAAEVGEATPVETVEGAVEAAECCQGTDSCATACKADCDKANCDKTNCANCGCASCDKANCDKADCDKPCDKKADCAEKKECCNKK